MNQPSLFGDDEVALGLGKESTIPFNIALLALGSVKGMGQKSLAAVVQRTKDNLGVLFDLDASSLTEFLTLCGVISPEKQAQHITKHHKELIHGAEDDFVNLNYRKISILPPSRIPERLKSINVDAPLWLFVEGDVDLLDRRPTIAVVGTRKPSDHGIEAARVIIEIISTYPITLISGLAEGIDHQAHITSLTKGTKNIAFLGHGINFTFPEVTAHTRRDIIKGNGAVVTEYLPFVHYQKSFFVERNRLQAGLADIVIPVEAQSTSGTAHTMRFARRYARTLIGIRWPGANGIVNDLLSNNDRVIDIFTSAGQKELDNIAKDLLKSVNADAYPFSNLEFQTKRELSNRNFTSKDVERFTQFFKTESVKRIVQEPPNG